MGNQGGGAPGVAGRVLRAPRVPDVGALEQGARRGGVEAGRLTRWEAVPRLGFVNGVFVDECA